MLVCLDTRDVDFGHIIKVELARFFTEKLVIFLFIYTLRPCKYALPNQTYTY